MSYIDEKCAVCGGQLIEKKIEKLLRGGKNMASVTVTAEVCLHRGERFYSPEIVERFEEIELKLKQEQTQSFQMAGYAFQVSL